MIGDLTLSPLVQQQAINFTGVGDNIIIAGVAGKIIRVLQFFFVCSTATTLTYKSGSTPISGPLSFVSNGAQVQDFIQCPFNCLNTGDPFIINASLSVTIGGTIWFIQDAAP